ncbi:hypothetical protein [Burkholderia ubonensis]|uniref:hypothetical protein n=1 Tax=Burkholderia ubonensis TaxID=101571 RepID=UPI000B111A95|nr:hypothetical protein [Burkholderia ubonensis]
MNTLTTATHRSISILKRLGRKEYENLPKIAKSAAIVDAVSENEIRGLAIHATSFDEECRVQNLKFRDTKDVASQVPRVITVDLAAGQAGMAIFRRENLAERVRASGEHG